MQARDYEDRPQLTSLDQWVADLKYEDIPEDSLRAAPGSLFGTGFSSNKGNFQRGWNRALSKGAKGWVPGTHGTTGKIRPFPSYNKVRWQVRMERLISSYQYVRRGVGSLSIGFLSLRRTEG